MRRLSIFFVVAALAASASFFSSCVPFPPIPVKKATPQPPVAGRPAPLGLLLLARGGEPEDGRALEALRNAAEAAAPSALAAGLANPAAIQRAIDALAARRIRRILAIPLFAEPQNELVMQTRFVLGLGPTLSADMINALKQYPRYRTTLFLEQASSPVPLAWSAPVGNAPVFAGILAKRARRLSRTPSSETLVLVGRGSGIDALDAASVDALSRLAAALRARLGLARASAATLRTDATPQARSRAVAALREIVDRAAAHGRAIVLLDSVCDDGMEARVRSSLRGLRYAFDPRPLGSESALRRWIAGLGRRAADG